MVVFLWMTRKSCVDMAIDATRGFVRHYVFVYDAVAAGTAGALSVHQRNAPRRPVPAARIAALRLTLGELRARDAAQVAARRRRAKTWRSRHPSRE